MSADSDGERPADGEVPQIGSERSLVECFVRIDHAPYPS
jgi:hypothetical protein